LGEQLTNKPMTRTSVKTRRKFNETFKREAVNNWFASRKSAEVIVQELGINASRLSAWKQRLEDYSISPPKWMVEPRRLELLTFSLRTRRSTN
jgi:transposase-like protein